jgi:hypothetical protein
VTYRIISLSLPGSLVVQGKYGPLKHVADDILIVVAKAVEVKNLPPEVQALKEGDLCRVVILPDKPAPEHENVADERLA